MARKRTAIMRAWLFDYARMDVSPEQKMRKNITLFVKKTLKNAEKKMQISAAN
jgi:hypothetical protein